MKKVINLVGKTFGRLNVIKRADKRGQNGEILWFCKCTCGAEVAVLGASLRGGTTGSCGCLHKESITNIKTTHGLSKHPLYGVWKNMKARCINPKNKYYSNYGGRGIKVCGKWSESFGDFYEDVKVGWKKSLELDRIDNDGNYSPENCRWVTSGQNRMNIRSAENSTSKYKGVSSYKGGDRWISQISKNNKKYYLGIFTCEKEAALVYNVKAKEFFGGYANINKIEG